MQSHKSIAEEEILSFWVLLAKLFTIFVLEMEQRSTELQQLQWYIVPSPQPSPSSVQ